MGKILQEINHNIKGMNKVSKRILTYGLLGCIFTIIGAALSFIFARVYWDYYDYLNQICDKLLELFQIFAGAVIISIFIEIVHISVKNQ